MPPPSDLRELLTSPVAARLALRRRYRIRLVFAAMLFFSLGIGWFWLLYRLIRDFGPIAERFYASLGLPFLVNVLGGIFLFMWGGLLNIAVVLPGLLLIYRYSASAWYAAKLGLSPTHDRALELVLSTRPFVLYLRSYGIERRMEHDGISAKEVPSQARKVGYEEPETKPVFYAAPALTTLTKKTRLPIVCLRNQAAPDPYRSQLLEIDYFGDDWLKVVRELAARSACVVVDIDKIGRGLHRELTMLSSSDSASKCIVVTESQPPSAMTLRCVTVDDFKRINITHYLRGDA